MTPRTLLIAAGLMGGLGIAMGAFAAHSLEGWLAVQGVPAADFPKRLAWLETAARYQQFHAVALLALAALANTSPTWQLKWPPILMISGVAIFSGCLYLMALTGIKVLGAIVPIGGVLLIASWLALCLPRRTAS